MSLKTEVLDVLEQELLLKNLEIILKKSSIDLINGLDQHGFGLIHYFALTDNSECLELMQNYGASLNIETKDGYTALMMAV